MKDNPVTHEKIKRGKMLFFDPRLSTSGLISCNTCHNLGNGDDDKLATSVGRGWQYVLRAASLRNVAITAPYFDSGQI